jgi:hypothetical protein
MRTIDQKELRRLAVIAAEAVGLDASDVTDCMNREDEDLPAVWIGDSCLALVRNEGQYDKEGAPVLVWQMNTFDYYDGVKEALADAVATEAYERAATALTEAGVGDKD